MRRLRGPVVLLLASSAACARSAAPPATPPPVIQLPEHIVTAREITTEDELAARGEKALVEQRWNDAADAYRTLLAASPAGPRAATYLFDLGLALEGLEDRGRARDTFLDLATRFPDDRRAPAALIRAATLDAYVEDWSALAAIGDTLLARPDLDDMGRIVALGARGLARVELGEDAQRNAKTADAPPFDAHASDLKASDDILAGLDLADRLHYSERDVLPVAVAQLRFALAELRRVRSERIVFDPLPPDFLDKLDERCGGLLEAQAAYAQAVRSIDPHWAAMSGYRVGRMYRDLHRDLMAIPPPPTSKTEHQKQSFYAFMHVRYRVLLEKGLREIDQTIALGERTADSSAWIARARDAKVEMETALADEKAQIEKMPFTELEVKTALDLLSKKALAAQSPKKP